MRSWGKVAGLSLAGALVVASCSGSTTDTNAGPAGTTGTTVFAGSKADSEGKEWPVYGHDPANSRTNASETAINVSTVAKLTKQWQKEGLIGVTGTPTFVDGVLYFADWTGKVNAVKADTGDDIWSTPLGGRIVGAPAVAADGVYESSGVTLAKYDKATGKVLWSVKTDDHPQAQINASPVVVDDLVLQGTASFENTVKKDVYSFRGSIAAYDTATGAQKWKFYTTPNDATAGPGGGVWSTPAVDVKRGLLYVGTGQSLAEPTAPLADSIIALDYKTGALKWSKQFTYPDVFSAGNPHGKDADIGASPNLWTSNGRDLVGAGDKGGTFHAVDRDTGESAWDTTLTPGSAFGGEIGSAAFVDGALVATSNVGDPNTNAPTDTTKVFALDPASGAIRWQSDVLPGKIFAPVSAVPGVAFVATDRGKLSAIDTKTGKELWSYDAPDKVACGPSIVNGRLYWGFGFVLFTGTSNGGVISFSVT